MYKFLFLGNTHRLTFDLTMVYYFWRADSTSPLDLIKLVSATGEGSHNPDSRFTSIPSNLGSYG
jgi:hypothetical protein